MKKSKKQNKRISRLKSIQASSADVGKIYLTKLGVLVIVKKIASNGVQVVPEFASKTLVIKKDALLFSCPKKKVNKKANLHFKACLRKWRQESFDRNIEKTTVPTPTHAVLPEPPQALSPKQAQRGPKGPRSGSVTSIVDPMLFSGTFTRQQINIALGESEIGKTLSNRDMGWYTAYRISVLKEKGYVLEKLENDILKVSKSVLNMIHL